MNSWLASLLGGALIGVASLILLLLIGRIAGVSGFILQAMKSSEERFWRLSFIIGILLGGGVYVSLSEHIALPQYAPEFSLDTIWYVVAGLLVGLGTSIGSGCTSGHGICGMSRLSIRSIIAVLVFMLVAMITASVFHNIVRV